LLDGAAAMQNRFSAEPGVQPEFIQCARGGVSGRGRSTSRSSTAM
jgi:hypothetical protein